MYLFGYQSQYYILRYLLHCWVPDVAEISPDQVEDAVLSALGLLSNQSREPDAQREAVLGLDYDIWYRTTNTTTGRRRHNDYQLVIDQLGPLSATAQLRLDREPVRDKLPTYPTSSSRDDNSDDDGIVQGGGGFT